MDPIRPIRLKRLSFGNLASAYIGQAIIGTLASQAETEDPTIAEQRFAVWKAVADRLAPEHWLLLHRTLGWLPPAEGSFIPAVPMLRGFNARAMPNGLIAAHVLVGRAISAALDQPSSFKTGAGDRESLAQTCFSWIDQICTDEAIVTIHVATGHVWRLDLLTPEGIDPNEYWPGFK